MKVEIDKEKKVEQVMTGTLGLYTRVGIQDDLDRFLDYCERTQDFPIKQRTHEPDFTAEFERLMKRDTE